MDMEYRQEGFGPSGIEARRAALQEKTKEFIASTPRTQQLEAGFLDTVKTSIAGIGEEEVSFGRILSGMVQTKEN